MRNGRLMDAPGHLDRLAKEHLLRRVALPLDTVREKHFPDAVLPR